jgi:hypothetical protein
MSQNDKAPITQAGLLSVLGLFVTLLVSMISALTTRLNTVEDRTRVAEVTIVQRLTRIEAKLDLLNRPLASQRSEGRR